MGVNYRGSRLSNDLGLSAVLQTRAVAIRVAAERPARCRAGPVRSSALHGVTRDRLKQPFVRRGVVYVGAAGHIALCHCGAYIVSPP
jgi:hypothetical protein